MCTSKLISVVIPVYNEEENIKPLTQWLIQVIQSPEGKAYRWEILFIDDGSSDRTWQEIRKMGETYPEWIRGVRLLRNYGKSAALAMGFSLARGDIIVTMDGDLQDSPEEILPLVRLLEEHQYHLVSGWKKHRQDPWSKTIPSRIFNWTVRLVTGIPLHDFNCGLKAYQRTVAKNLHPQGEMHRYLPVLAHWMGFRKIAEKPVRHYPRKYGKSKFGAERFLRGFLDLLTVLFLTRFGRRPMHLFGSLGFLFFLAGAGIGAYLSYLKLVENVPRIADRPLFFLGLLCMILGAQLFLSGFLAELIIRMQTPPPQELYLIQESVNLDDHASRK